jgi:hypothetical protein
VKIYLDDERTTPEGWFRTYTVAETIAALETGKVTEISLDHDLGSMDEDGYDVALWIEQAAAEGRIGRIKWNSHSANTAGRSRIEAALNSAERFWNERKGTED